MSSQIIEKFEDDLISEEILTAAAELFSQNYGIWDSRAAKEMGAFAKTGDRVKMSPQKLKEQILPSKPGTKNIYIRMKIDDKLVGNVFATKWIDRDRPAPSWIDGERPVYWITQLCVSSAYRNQGIAKKLLETLRDGNRDICGVGILSSHPFAIAAVLRVFGNGMENVDMEMMRVHARKVMSTCPVPYVREAKLHGSLFEEDVTDGSVSCADTGFWVDHREPLEALSIVHRKGMVWPLGYLPEGHEFLVLVDPNYLK